MIFIFLLLKDKILLLPTFAELLANAKLRKSMKIMGLRYSVKIITKKDESHKK